MYFYSEKEKVIPYFQFIYLGFYYSKRDFVQSKVYWNKILAIDPADEMANRAITIIDKAQKGKK